MGAEMLDTSDGRGPFKFPPHSSIGIRQPSDFDRASEDPIISPENSASGFDNR